MKTYEPDPEKWARYFLRNDSSRKSQVKKDNDQELYRLKMKLRMCRSLFMPPQFLILTPRTTLQNGYLTLFGDCPTQRIPHHTHGLLAVVY